ncbi:MAG: response regulator transcription factor [Myxococcaceae bacterium]
MITVALADDQTLVREGIRRLLELEADFRVIAEAGDGEAAIAMVRQHRPDVLLLDVRMPKKTGLEVLAALEGAVPALVLTTFDDDAVAVQALKLGAKGFLLKDVTRQQLAEAVRTLAGGGSLVSAAVTGRALEGAKTLPSTFEAAELPAPLTARELEVLRLIAGGLSNKEIATTLGTAEGTVKNQASAVLAKLGVRDRTRAVLRALELGVL